MEIVEPREAESISVKQALEWLAMGWTPYVDKDERLVSEDRDSIRGFFSGNKIKEEDEHLYSTRQVNYCNRMYKAIAALENILNKEKIKIYFSTEFYDENQLDVYEGGDIIEECTFTSFNIKILPEEIPILYMTAYYEDHEFGRYYVINDCFKFSELKKIEPLFTDNIQKEQEARDVINIKNYTTPEIRVINEVIKRYGGKEINKNIKLTVQEWIEKVANDLNIKLSKNARDAIFYVIRSPEGKKGGYKS